MTSELNNGIKPLPCPLKKRRSKGLRCKCLSQDTLRDLLRYSVWSITHTNRFSLATRQNLWFMWQKCTTFCSTVQRSVPWLRRGCRYREWNSSATVKPSRT